MYILSLVIMELKNKVKDLQKTLELSSVLQDSEPEQSDTDDDSLDITDSIPTKGLYN